MYPVCQRKGKKDGSVDWDRAPTFGAPSIDFPLRFRMTCRWTDCGGFWSKPMPIFGEKRLPLERTGLSIRQVRFQIRQADVPTGGIPCGFAVFAERVRQALRSPSMVVGNHAARCAGSVIARQTFSSGWGNTRV